MQCNKATVIIYRQFYSRLCICGFTINMYSTFLNFTSLIFRLYNIFDFALYDPLFPACVYDFTVYNKDNIHLTHRD
jgi:hypothetical protein